MNVNSLFDQIHHQDLKIGIPIVVGLISFIIFWFTHKSTKIQSLFSEKYGADLGSAKFIIFTKHLGGFTMGILPALAYFITFPETTLAQLGLALPKDTILMTILYSLGLITFVIPTAIFNAKKEKNLEVYPQIRAKIWNKKMLRGHLFSWATYLFGYEFLFRGVLFFPLVETIGLWPAIAVNIGMYSATHIAKGIKETIGAFVISIIFCLLTLHTGTIWIAFFVHLAMAWTNALTALKYHPDMEYVN